MDWSVGRLGALDGYLCLRNSANPSSAYVCAVTAQTWALINSTHLIGTNWIAQLDYGVVQTGGLRTSQQDGRARRIGIVLSTGLFLDDDDLVCDLPCDSVEYLVLIYLLYFQTLFQVS